MVKSKKEKKKLTDQEQSNQDIKGDNIGDESSSQVRSANPIVDKESKKGRKNKNRKHDSDDELDVAAENDTDNLSTSNSNKNVAAATSKNGKEEVQSQPLQQETTKKGNDTNQSALLDDEDLEKMMQEMQLEDEEAKRSKRQKSANRGKKGKKKKEATEDLDDDLLEIKKEMGMDVTDEINQLSNKDVDEVAAKSESKDEISEKTEDSNKQQPQGELIVKTAAQKKAEKKERERLKKQLEKEKAQSKAMKGKKDSETAKKLDSQEMAKGKEDVASNLQESLQADNQKVDTKEEGKDFSKAKPSQDIESSDEAEEGDGDTKKKKKRKKKNKGEKEESSKGKKPNKAKLKQMQEALAELKHQKDQIQAEEEEMRRKEEEAERLRLEKVKLEQERREKKKQKEKERRERLKKEGKLLTKAQKQEKAKIEARLEMMRQQGVELPSISGTQDTDKATKQRVVYGKKKKQKAKTQVQAEQEGSATVLENGGGVIGEPIGVEDLTSKEFDTENVELDKNLDDDQLDSWDKLEEQENTKEIEEEETSNKMEVEVDDKSAKSESSSEEEDEEESSSEETESESDDVEISENQREKILNRIQERRRNNEANRVTSKLRSPVICVLGHVDTGKTKILDKIRRTNVQDGEAGGITQQIGATMVPLDAISDQTKHLKDFADFDVKLPGLLIIDTPGHESFSNLRNRGSSLCDIAILVIDIMHGLEPQTLESINLLKKRKTPFVVALNKIDRLYEWKKAPRTGIVDTLKKQKRNVRLEFEDRVRIVITALAEQGLNAALFFDNQDPRKFVSLVPTSAVTGDGMADMMALIVKLSQTLLQARLSYSAEVECTVLEVKALPGLGTTVDVVLTNGKLNEGDTMVFCGLEGPIVTQSRALLTTPPLREIRVKNQYIKHHEIEAAQGIKIIGKDLDKVLAGTSVLIAMKPDEVDILKEEVAARLEESLSSIKLSERGVYVQASTLGSLEALLEFLKTSKIPYSGINVGPVHKKDVMRASVMLEHDTMYAVILAFDVKVEQEANEIARKLGVKIFSADIIYHLFDNFTSYREDLKKKLKEQHKHLAIFPAKLRILPQFIFNARDPIVVGVIIEDGTLKCGTPITALAKEHVDIGVITSLEINHKSVETAEKGQEVCIKIENIGGDAPKLFGRHFDATNLLVSKISRESIDILKDYFRDEMQKQDWILIKELKKHFGII